MTTTNWSVYESVAKPIVSAFLDGKNGRNGDGGRVGTIIVYGPTGAGKTYTMLGSEKKQASLREAELGDIGSPSRPQMGSTECSGLLFYGLQQVFRGLEGSSELQDPTQDCETKPHKCAADTFVRCAYVEIYNDNIYDLLKDKTALSAPLSVNENESREFVIKGAADVPVRSLQDLVQVIRKGERTFLIYNPRKSSLCPERHEPPQLALAHHLPSPHEATQHHRQHTPHRPTRICIFTLIELCGLGRQREVRCLQSQRRRRRAQSLATRGVAGESEGTDKGGSIHQQEFVLSDAGDC
jgi:hypothetical protein